MPVLLTNVVQPYAWGSRSAIAALQGRAVPSPTPEAELWMGAHPLAPSRRPDGERLDAWIARAPDEALGPRVRARFAERLPFLLKVLAAAAPLSLQAHPSSAQAEAGFAREDAAGIPRDAPHRNYKDRFHKPELLVALTPFTALSGFRPIPDVLALFDELGVPAAVAPIRARPDPAGLAETFRILVGDARHVAPVLAALERAPATTRFSLAFHWARRVAALYPGDPGIVVTLLLEVLELAPFEGVFLPAGNLHAYLEGTGIEVMASSDNVLRGGLTPKHVDVPELLATLDFAAPPCRPRAAVARAGEEVWDTRDDATEFLLSRVVVAPSAPFTARVDGPEVLLCTRGAVRIERVGGATSTVALGAGAAAFVPAADAEVQLVGDGEVFRARVPG